MSGSMGVSRRGVPQEFDVMKNGLLCCAVALAFVTGPAASEDSAPPTDAAKSKIVCKKEPTVGSKIPTRICKTQEQIETEKQNAKEATNAFQRDGDFQLHGGS
jgi:hypothetical protein